MPARAFFVTLAAALIWAAGAATAQTDTERVSFAPGTSGTVIRGRIVGDRIVDYVLGAALGQRLVVDMTTSNPSAYFNVMLKDAPEAIHVGSIYGLHYEGTLPASGDWVIRVYLMRNAARRGEAADYTIDLGIDATSTAAVVAPAAGTMAENACLEAVIRTTNNTQVEVVSSDFSEAGTMVRLAVGPDAAPWQCIAYNDGSTDGVMFLGDDSGGIAPPARQDYADVNSGGPDWWQVTGAGSLNIRAGAGTGFAVVGRAAEGQLLRNLGCQGEGSDRWCRVEADEGATNGWVAGRFLREGAAPQGTGQGTNIPSGSPLEPQLYIRPTGEIEASWSSGCTVLYNPARTRINAGASCSQAQLTASDLRVAEMDR